MSCWFCFFSILCGQNYTLTIWGFKVGYVSIEDTESLSINITAKSTGITDYFWPFNNQYKASFAPVTFGFQTFEKKIVQGTFKQNLQGEWSDERGGILYKKTFVKRDKKCQTIFSVLYRVQQESPSILDTKWFQTEHEGELFNVRLLLADSLNIWAGNDSVFCDHYRIDIKATSEKQIKILDKTDYFHENITHPKLTKQLWVEKHGERRIIQASVKMTGVTLKAVINNE